MIEPFADGEGEVSRCGRAGRARAWPGRVRGTILHRPNGCRGLDAAAAGTPKRA